MLAGLLACSGAHPWGEEKKGGGGGICVNRLLTAASHLPPLLHGWMGREKEDEAGEEGETLHVRYALKKRKKITSFVFFGCTQRFKYCTTLQLRFAT